MEYKSLKQAESILIMFHCAQHTGYAIASLERVFFQAALSAGFLEKNIYWSYQSIGALNDSNIIECNYAAPNEKVNLKSFLEMHNITFALAFDLGVTAPVNKVLRKGGVKKIVTYWGASMSGLNSGIKLMLKKLECQLIKSKPDTYIFESEAMRKTATLGRGISVQSTEVVYLGVDVLKFYPCYDRDHYAHQIFAIPLNRKIIFYSGHMEERKGVRVIVQAALHLIDSLNYTNIHFIICGNKSGEADAYESLLTGSGARQHVTFAGYRTDIPELMRSAYIGVIASTGWDSFTMSSVEMMASGLPLIVSDLQGLSETIDQDENGYLINPGDYQDLANKIMTLVDDAELATRFSVSSRARAENLFSQQTQIQHLTAIIKKKMHS